MLNSPDEVERVIINKVSDVTSFVIEAQITISSDEHFVPKEAQAVGS